MTSRGRDHGVMNREQVAKALTRHDHAYQEMAEILFGDGAYELVSKLDPGQSDLATSDKSKKHRRQAQVGLASNVLGLTAGTAGLASAARDDRFKQGGKFSRKFYRAGKKIPAPFSSKSGKAGALLAGGAVGLQAANLGGDVVANRVLARSAKKPEKTKKTKKVQPKDVYKSERPEELAPTKGKLIRLGARKGTPQLKKIVVDHTRKNPSHQEKVGKGVWDDQVEEIWKKWHPEDVEITWEGEISKMDTDKRQVFGWASVVEVNGEPVYDLQGDFMTSDEIEKAAYEYVQKSRKGGDNHRRDGEDPHHASTMIESFMVTPEKVEKMGLPAGSLPTGWWVGYQVHDDDLWGEVKKGKRTNFSIHGRGVRKEMT